MSDFKEKGFNEEEQTLKKKKTVLFSSMLKLKILSGVLFIALIAVAALGIRTYFQADSKTIRLGFENIGELATQSAYCTVVGDNQKNIAVWGLDILFTDSIQIYSYDVIIKAGFDFAQIDWDVKESKGVIEVTLPEAKVLSTEIQLDSFNLYYEDESVFSHFTLEENNEGLKKLEQEAEQQAVDGGLLENARENGEILVRNFFAGVYDPEQYTVEFVDAK